MYFVQNIAWRLHFCKLGNLGRKSSRLCIIFFKQHDARGNPPWTASLFTFVVTFDRSSEELTRFRTLLNTSKNVSGLAERLIISIIPSQNVLKSSTSHEIREVKKYTNDSTRVKQQNVFCGICVSETLFIVDVSWRRNVRSFECFFYSPIRTSECLEPWNCELRNSKWVLNELISKFGCKFKVFIDFACAFVVTIWISGGLMFMCWRCVASKLVSTSYRSRMLTLAHTHTHTHEIAKVP